MSWKVSCPHCQSVLNVTEKAVGQELPCPACKQLLKVPQLPGPTAGASAADNPRTFSADSQYPDTPVTPPPPPTPLPTGMPPLPEPDGIASPAFPESGESPPDGVFPDSRHRLHGIARGGLTDMFLGKGKQFVFRLVPGERRLDELTIYRRHLFFIERGITRVILTTHRVLCTETRVFSPAYWVLVVLFPALMLYYVFRIGLNRHVSIALNKIDSIEKSYRPNWLLFILATLAAHMLAGIAAFAVMKAFDPRMDSLSLEWTIRSVVLGLAAAAVLALLLATRLVGVEIRSIANNKFPVRFGSGDLGVSEARFDLFVQKLCSEVERARTFAGQAEPIDS